MDSDRGFWTAFCVVGTVAALILAVIALVAATDDAPSSPSVPTTAPAAGGGEGEGEPVSTTVKASLTEFAVDLSPAEVPAGEVALDVTNDGQAPHTLVLEGTDTKQPELAAGEAGHLDLGELEPGDYVLFCDIPGHRPAGMEATLTVKEGAAAPAAGEGDHGDGADYAALDQAMADSIAAFPAKTEGLGGQRLEPTVVNGVKRFELTAAITEWEVSPGKVVDAWTYNGQVPGPVIAVGQGEDFEVVVRNELPMGTDVHFHGLDLTNEMDGVAPITQPLIKPGESFTYKLRTDRPAVAMYHAHHHAQMQVPNGLLGTVLVGQVPVPAGARVDQEQVMVLNDAGAIGYSLNGKSFPATAPYTAERGEWILLHYLNEGLQIHPMHLHGMEQVVIAKDGYRLPQPYTADTVTVAPGERYSVLIHADVPGTWVWHCHILNHVEREEGMFGMVTALVVS